MIHPLENLLPNQRNQLGWISLLAAAIVFAAIYAADLPLKTINVQVGPFRTAGLVGLSLSGSPEIASDVCGVWRGELRFLAGLALGLDFLLILLYGVGLAALAVSLGERLRGTRPVLFLCGRFAAWSVWIAAAADVLENVGLLRQLSATPATPWTEVTFFAATTKFILLGLAVLVLIAVGLMAWKTPVRQSAP